MVFSVPPGSIHENPLKTRLSRSTARVNDVNSSWAALGVSIRCHSPSGWDAGMVAVKSRCRSPRPVRKSTAAEMSDPVGIGLTWTVRSAGR